MIAKMGEVASKITGAVLLHIGSKANIFEVEATRRQTEEECVEEDRSRTGGFRTVLIRYCPVDRINSANE